ncbi:MAG: leucine-rich repeat domain-containing protein [Muribaculaceae bacterium]
MRKIYTQIQRQFALLVLATIPCLAFAATKIGDFYYNLNSEDKTAEVTYKTLGMTYFDSTYVIPESVEYEGVTYSVTKIGDNAFYNSSLTSLTIPTSVETIGELALCFTKKLQSLTIPNSVKKIDYRAFYYSGITSIDIPDSVTEMGEETFYSASLTSVTFGSGLKTIPNRSFHSCTSLTSINIPNTITEIGREAFSNCSAITSINLGESVTTISPYAFSSCSSFSTLTIPASVTSIGDRAFAYCTSLTTLTFSGSDSDSDTELTFGTQSFYDNPNIKTIYAARTTPPTSESITFLEEILNDIKLYVPTGCKDTYCSVYPWSRITHIEETNDFGGIEDITSDDVNSNLPIRYYNLNGDEVRDNTAPGLYIRVQGNKVEKVLMK